MGDRTNGILSHEFVLDSHIHLEINKKHFKTYEEFIWIELIVPDQE